MSEEKQTIKAMAKDLCDIQYKGMKCRICYGGCECHMLAEALYNVGYRKQSEGEWMQDFDGDYYCPFCAHYPKEIKHYCPNCGAHMRKEDEGK